MTEIEGLFPLKLVDFEHYMLVDDHADYPMVIRMDLDLEGNVDRERLENALDETVEENPLLRSTVKDVSGQLYWELGTRSKIEWFENPPENMRLNLREAPGLKIFGRQNEDNSSITSLRVFIHHCVADGAGINHFIERWFTHYRDRKESTGVQEASKVDQETNVENLKNRGWFGMNFFWYLLRPFQEFCGVIGILDYFMHRPVAIGPQNVELSEPPSQSEPLSIRYGTKTLDLKDSKQILANSKQLGHKINDLMLTAMFESFHHWLDEHQPDQANGCVRIMIPMDMRNKKQPERFVGNKVSMIFVDRRPARYKSLKHLCWWVWIETAACKMMRLSLSFFHLIRYFRFRKKLDKLLRRDRPVASTVLSNMGPVLHRTPLTDSEKKIVADGISLKKYNVYPPIRAYTWYCAVITTYRNQINIHSAWCDKALSTDDVEQIVNRFQTNLVEGFGS